jgi:hypothetical protein
MTTDSVQLAPGQRERLQPAAPRDGGEHVDEELLRAAGR